MARAPHLRRPAFAGALAAALALAACAGRNPYPPPPGPFSEIAYATWRDDEPGYRFYPGDALDVSTPSAPELSRSVVVQPDGRITMPLVGSVMAADRTVPELQAALAQGYAGQLLDPRVEVAVRQAVPIRVFVGGEVGKPGVYDMPGDIDVLQAVVMAGGLLTTSEPRQVVLIRRGPDGRPMMRLVDMGDAVHHAPVAGAIPLRRFDVVFVPRSRISNVGLWVQQYLRDVVPVQFSYAAGANNYLTTR